MQHVHHRVLDVLDAERDLVAGALEVLDDHARQLGGQGLVVDADGLLGAQDGVADARVLEGHLLPVALDHRGGPHGLARWFSPMTRRSSTMNSSRSLNWR